MNPFARLDIVMGLSDGAVRSFFSGGSMFAKRLLAVALGLSLAGCVTRGEIEEIKKKQDQILTKLDGIAKGGRGGAGAADAQRPRGPDPQKVYAFPIEGSAIKGSPDAWVTIVEVSDFQCPFCNRVNPTLKEIQDKYPNDVRFVFKHNALPFHNRALPAAMAAECANEQGKFWQMHDELFANQRALEDTNLEEYAKKVGVNGGKWKDCYSSNKFKEKVEADMKLANQLGARGTPAFFINGRFLSGAQPFASFQAVIDEELKKAKESGISKKDYYAKAVVEKGEKSAM
jgi:protein-disulfide isomerase